MNVMELPEDTDDDDGDDMVIAEHSPANWEKLAQQFIWVIAELRAGRMDISKENENRGIIGPQVDGCVRVDVELCLVPVFPLSPSNSRRRK
jgi:hypothetical protein